MRLRVLGSADFRVMPWKDGGGVTTELLIHPEGATVAGGFLWRLSRATVSASGPFSAFPGMDRSLCVLSGELAVDLDGAEAAVLRPGSGILRFSGDRVASGRVLRGPVEDFNVISDRRRVRHDLCRLSGPDVALPDAPFRILAALGGVTEVRGVRVEPGGLLRVEGAGPLTARVEGEALLVRVHPLEQVAEVRDSAS